MMVTTTLPAQSARYRARLRSYLEAVVDRDGTFCCVSGQRCARSLRSGHTFAAGQLSYVGSHYATEVNGREHRVLVVSMQVGRPEAPVDMDRRSIQVRERIPEPPGTRNPHMRGVTFALQYLFGSDPGGSEHLPDGTHVLDAYSMVNSTLCSALADRTTRGAPTSTMLRECSRHLRATIEILEPTVIHAQGWSSKPKKHTTTSSVLRAVDHHERVDEWNYQVRVGDLSSVLCGLPHPSTIGRYGWQWPSSFLQQEVGPALRAARALAAT